MKANKAKTSNKAEKKVAKQLMKKELETSISAKFLDALRGLGHDAEKFTKEIRKTSKELAKKIAKKYKDAKIAVEDKLEGNAKVKPLNTVKKPVSAPKKVVAAAIKKAEKVVAKVQKTTVPTVRAARNKSIASAAASAPKTSGSPKVPAVKKPVMKKTSGPKPKSVE